MGLDMYLIKRKKGDRRKVWQCEEVMYWRKANAIHKWFVENCQKGEDNCRPHLVRKTKMKELCGICKAILDNTELVDAKVMNGKRLVNGEWEPIMEDGKIMKDTSLAETLLPTTSGFFFGSTDYDQWYYEDVKRTYEKLNEIIEENEFDEYNFYYESSW